MKMGMSSHFEFTSHIKHLLFYGWNTDNAGGMLATCIFFLLSTMLLEGMKALQLNVIERANTQPVPINLNAKPGEHTPLLKSTDIPRTDPEYLRRKKILFHCVLTAITVLQLVIAYAIMLAVMTYNAWIFMSVILGSAIGYFIFMLIQQRQAMEKNQQEVPSQPEARDDT